MGAKTPFRNFQIKNTHTYSSLQLNEVQNQEFTNQIILLLPASCLLPPASCLKTSDFVPHAKENCCIVGWASRPPVVKGGQDVHPTRLDNLFFGSR